MIGAKHTPATARIQRRFEVWELEHLRHLAADLAQCLEAAEARAADAEDRASRADELCDFWHDQAVERHNQVADEAGGMPGLTMGGQLVVVTPNRSGRLHS